MIQPPAIDCGKHATLAIYVDAYAHANHPYDVVNGSGPEDCWQAFQLATKDAPHSTKVILGHFNQRRMKLLFIRANSDQH